MSGAALIIIGLLLAILLACFYVMFRTIRAFRVLEEKRMEVYTAHMIELNETMTALRQNTAMPKLNPTVGTQLDLFASFPTMRKSGEVLQSFAVVVRKRLTKASASEISAAIQLAERELVALNVAMREDMALNVGKGRFPNAEAFRRRRGGKNNIPTPL